MELLINVNDNTNLAVMTMTSNPLLYIIYIDLYVRVTSHVREFGLRYPKIPMGPSISGPRGECTINCTSGANMVLCPPQWSKLGRTKS